MDSDGVRLLKNSVEQSFVEKLRSLLIFGSNSRRYKDIFDLFYLKNLVNEESLKKIISVLIFDDDGMRENDFLDVVKRVETTFKDKPYLKRVSESRQRWLDDDIESIAAGILEFLKELI